MVAEVEFDPRFFAYKFSLFHDQCQVVFQPWKSPDTYFSDQFHLLFLIYYERKMWPINDSLEYVYLSNVLDQFFCECFMDIRQKCICVLYLEPYDSPYI